MTTAKNPAMVLHHMAGQLFDLAAADPDGRFTYQAAAASLLRHSADHIDGGPARLSDEAGLPRIVEPEPPRTISDIEDLIGPRPRRHRGMTAEQKVQYVRDLHAWNARKARATKTGTPPSTRNVPGRHADTSRDVPENVPENVPERAESARRTPPLASPPPTTTTISSTAVGRRTHASVPENVPNRHAGHVPENVPVGTSQHVTDDQTADAEQALIGAWVSPVDAAQLVQQLGPAAALAVAPDVAAAVKRAAADGDDDYNAGGLARNLMRTWLANPNQTTARARPATPPAAPQRVDPVKAQDAEYARQEREMIAERRRDTADQYRRLTPDEIQRGRKLGASLKVLSPKTKQLLKLDPATLDDEQTQLVQSAIIAALASRPRRMAGDDDEPEDPNRHYAPPPSEPSPDIGMPDDFEPARRQYAAERVGVA